MKRNEKFLVYAVTGFLAVILVIAIVFGNEDLEPQLASKTEAEVAKQGPVTAGTGIAAGRGMNLRDILMGRHAPVAQIGDPQGDPEVGGEPAEGPGAELDPGTEAPAGVGAVALDSNVVPAPVTTSAQVALLFGPSVRDRTFREVEARSGDSFSKLVQNWCGSLDYLGEAKRLNETEAMLKPGHKVILPWVTDEVILAAHKARQAAPAIQRTGPEPAVADGSRPYEVVAGDSVWAIAVREVGTREAPGYIEQIKSLNPQIANFDVLRVGQKIRLPAKP